MRFQRLLQIPVFFLFLLLLWLAAFPLATRFEVDWFLRLDPLISLGSMLAARAFIPRLAWVLIILGLTLILGRLFCGYICPMGATIDFSDWLSNREKKGSTRNSFEASGKYRKLKYYFLILSRTSSVSIKGFFLFLISKCKISYYRPISSNAMMGIKCHYDLSEYYVTSCVNAMLLNDPYDWNGPKPSTVMACEADSDGALTMQILKLISGYPSLLFDARSYDFENKVLVCCNCGAQPSWYAARSDNPEEYLSKVSMEQPPTEGEMIEITKVSKSR